MYAKYSVVLKELMENEQTREELEVALSEYPVYEPKEGQEIPAQMVPNRSELNERVLNAYKYREIGFETVGRFLDELRIAMNEIMPYYNQLYDTVVIMNNIPSPFDNVDIVETMEQTSQGNQVVDETSNATSEGNASSSMTGKNVDIDTPQSNITIKVMDEVDYASEIRLNEDGSTSSNSATAENESNRTSTDSHTSSYTMTKKGNQGVNTYAHDMIEFREAIIDVTNQIINDERISELFMRVY